MKLRTVILLSGGLDSAVNLQKARQETESVLALTFDYGQKAAQEEITSASAMCSRVDVPHRTVPLPWLGEITATALVSPDRELPSPSEDELDRPDESSERAAAVWVPNRNGVFVAVGAAFAALGIPLWPASRSSLTRPGWTRRPSCAWGRRSGRRWISFGPVTVPGPPTAGDVNPACA
jgi:hypothetical protein